MIQPMAFLPLSPDSTMAAALAKSTLGTDIEHLLTGFRFYLAPLQLRLQLLKLQFII